MTKQSNTQIASASLRPRNDRKKMTLLQEADKLKKTPLFDSHVALGGKMVDFGGWNLPVYYTSILSEHNWARTQASFFDVSHLGEIRVHGPGALEFLQH